MGVSDSNRPIEEIAPDGFVDRYEAAETIDEALRLAEADETTTPREEMSRCEVCDSTRLVPKARKWSPDQLVDSSYWCESCGSHVEGDAPKHAGPPAPWSWAPADEDDPPLADVDRETAAAVALALREPWTDERDPPYRVIASVLPYSDTWVAERVHEYREDD